MGPDNFDQKILPKSTKGAVASEILNLNLSQITEKNTFLN